MNTPHKLVGCLAAFFVITLSQGIAAVVTTSVTNTAPTESWLQIGTAPTSNTAVIYYSSSSPSASWHRDSGQTFFTGETPISLSSFTFQIYSNAPGTEAKGGSITLSLYEFSSATANTPAGPALYTATGLLPASMAQNDYLTFTLDAPQILDANKFYGVMIGFTNEGTSNSQSAGQWLPIASVSGAYTNGVQILYSTTAAGNPARTWSNSVNADLFVFIGATPVPEPGISALIGMSIALLLCRRRRQTALSWKTGC